MKAPAGEVAEARKRSLSNEMIDKEVTRFEDLIVAFYGTFRRRWEKQGCGENRCGRFSYIISVTGGIGLFNRAE